MPNRTEARPAKAALTNATGRLPLLRLFSTPLIIRGAKRVIACSQQSCSGPSKILQKLAFKAIRHKLFMSPIYGRQQAVTKLGQYVSNC